MRRDLGVGIGLEGLPPEALDTDRALAEVLAEGPFVLGYPFDFDAATGASCVLHPLRASVRSDAGGRTTRICSTPRASSATFRSSRGRPVPPAFSTSLPIPTDPAARSPGDSPQGAPLPASPWPSTCLSMVATWYWRRVGWGRVAPHRREGHPSRPAGEPPGELSRPPAHLPARLGRGAAGRNGRPGRASGKMVILGTTAAGLKEIRTTPLDAAQPGAEIHATVIDDILSGDPIAQPRWATGSRSSGRRTGFPPDGTPRQGARHLGSCGDHPLHCRNLARLLVAAGIPPDLPSAAHPGGHPGDRFHPAHLLRFLQADGR